jgi:hypothetical protein
VEDCGGRQKHKLRTLLSVRVVSRGAKIGERRSQKWFFSKAHAAKNIHLLQTHSNNVVKEITRPYYTTPNLNDKFS